MLVSSNLTVFHGILNQSPVRYGKFASGVCFLFVVSSA